MVVNFAPSQLSYEDDTSPINFRLSPFNLLLSDLKLVPQLLLTLLNLVLPFATDNPRGELNLRVGGNVVSIILQTYVGLVSGLGLLGVFVVIFVPISVAGFGVYCAMIAVLCAPALLYLNSGDVEVGSTSSLLSGSAVAKFKQEKWFFVNGIIVGNFWLQSAVDELSVLFGRQVWGIRNRTAGVFFDLIECLIQRDLGYATQDVREAYEKIKLALVDEGLTRVVIIVHSQGGIVMSMALDNLLSDLPREYFKKMEIYTFGSAANHFNNPRLAYKLNSLAAVTAIEHYANAKDPVSLIGVLKFLPLVAEDPLNVYAGRLFERPDKSGHMFVQHYLDTMFGPNQDFLDMPMSTQHLRPPGKTEDPKEIGARTQTVRQVSRLAQYLDGKSPIDPPTPI